MVFCAPRKGYLMIICIALIVLSVALDQLSKWLVVTYLPAEGLNLIDGVLRFTYVENRGAAFGMLAEKRWVFIIVSTLAIIAMLIYLIKFKPQNRLLRAALVLIIGGGIGNMIDRVLLGYVVDFIDFYAFPSLWVWVFNIADACVCIGAGLMILYLILSTVEEARAEKLKRTVVQDAGIMGGGQTDQRTEYESRNPEPQTAEVNTETSNAQSDTTAAPDGKHEKT